VETEIAFRRIGSGRRVPRGGSRILAYEQQEIYGEHFRSIGRDLCGPATALTAIVALPKDTWEWATTGCVCILGNDQGLPLKIFVVMGK